MAMAFQLWVLDSPTLSILGSGMVGYAGAGGWQQLLWDQCTGQADAELGGRHQLVVSRLG